MSSCGPDLCDKPPVVAQNNQGATSSAGGRAGTLPVEGDVTGVNEKSSTLSNSSQRKCLRPPRSVSLGSHLDGSAAGIELSGAASGDGSQRVPRSTPRREDAPPNIFFILSVKLMKTWGEACSFWRKVREDRFSWLLFKNILFFTVGLKLFNDLTRHLASPPSRCGRSSFLIIICSSK